ncbi:TetR/AcrR family transcriptional regulator [Kribbella sp. NPDC051952]|uniref:TetR/AcrR family transcriptional regulator n=1 Tax=Kribbella sp. NPDC051952 TaxID=3154851 RepID=UPI00341B0B1E
MSPQRRDPAVRVLLIEAAAKVLAEEGVAALTTRRLARETERSTMAVYTHLGGMEEVQRAVREEGFLRLAADIERAGQTSDPVADLIAASTAYVRFGLANPHLYRAMVVDRPVEQDDAGVGAFEEIVTGLRRCIDDGRIPEVEHTMVVIWAAQVWSMRHGIVSMVLSGAVAEEHAHHVLLDMILRLLIGYGDDGTAARRSVRDATDRAEAV